MKHAKYLLVAVVALAIAIPVGMTAVASEDDPNESPDVSVSGSPKASESESPGASESETPEVSRSPGASVTPDDDDIESSTTPKASSSPKASSTMKPSKTPEQEDEEEDVEGSPEESNRPEKTPRVSVPPELEDDVDELLEDDDDITEVEIDDENGSVEVKYKLRAKLFGFIDVPYELEARVEAKEGEMNVKAKGPWWLIFARDNSDEVQEALEADETLADATNQGTVLSTIIGILKDLAGK